MTWIAPVVPLRAYCKHEADMLPPESQTADYQAPLPKALHAQQDYLSQQHLLALQKKQEQKKNMQLDSFPGSDLVHSVDTTPVVSAPDMSTSGALASGAAGTGPVLETSRQSDPTLQTRPNDFEDRLSYARSGLSSPNTPWLAYPDLAGGVPNAGSSSLYPTYPSTLYEPISTAPDWVSYRRPTSPSLSFPRLSNYPDFPQTSSPLDWVMFDPTDKPEIEQPTTYFERQSSPPRPFETSYPHIRMPKIYHSSSLSSLPHYQRAP